MHVAAELGSLSAIKIILSVSGNQCLEQRDHSNCTPLILATRGGHGEVVNFLLAEGAAAAAVDKFGATAWDHARSKPLHYCMLIIASYLRQQQVDEEEEDVEQGTAPPWLEDDNKQFQGIGERLSNEAEPPSQSLPHPPPFQSTVPGSRTPRSVRHGFLTPRASEDRDEDDGANAGSAFRKVVRKEEQRQSENGTTPGQAANTKEEQGEHSPHHSRSYAARRIRQRGGRRPADRHVEDESSSDDSDDPKRLEKPDRRRSKVAADRISNEKQLQRSPGKEKQVVVVASRHKQVSADGTRNDITQRPLNSEVRIHGTDDRRNSRRNKENLSDASISYEESHDEGRDVNPRFSSYVELAQDGGHRHQHHHDHLHRHGNGTKDGGTDFQTPRPDRPTRTQDTHEDRESESELDVMLDEVMSGFRNEGSNSSRQMRNRQMKSATDTRTSQAARKPTAARQNTDIDWNEDGKNGSVVRPAPRYSKQQQQQINPAKRTGNFDLAPLSPKLEDRSRARFPPSSRSAVQAATVSNSAFVASSSPRSSGTNVISPRLNTKKKAFTTTDEVDSNLNNSGRRNPIRKEHAMDNHHPVSSQVNAHLNRQPYRSASAAGNNDDDDDDDEDEYAIDDNSDYEDSRHLGQAKGQAKASAADKARIHSGQRNLKDLSRDPPQNAQFTKDNPRPKGAVQLNPLLIPIRNKQTVPKIPPVVTMSSLVHQKLTDNPVARKPANGQLPSAKY